MIFRTTTFTGEGEFMSFLCCGVKYSKNDPETYWCIDTDLIKPALKKFVGNHKINYEIVETLTCKKNGCIKVQVHRYGLKKGKKTKFETMEYKGFRAVEYLEETSAFRQRQDTKCPNVNVPSSSKNDFVYGKVIDGTTQKIRYLNEQGFASDEKLIQKVKYIKKNG